MAHNSLRRELSAALDAIKHPPTPDLPLDCAWAARLFDRCLNALGGPVADARPIIEGEIVKDEASGLGDTPHTPTEVEAADIGRPLDDVDHDLIRLGSDGH